jgi:hypothetical protein
VSYSCRLRPAKRSTETRTTIACSFVLEKYTVARGARWRPKATPLQLALSAVPGRASATSTRLRGRGGRRRGTSGGGGARPAVALTKHIGEYVLLEVAVLGTLEGGRGVWKAVLLILLAVCDTSITSVTHRAPPMYVN